MNRPLASVVVVVVLAAAGARAEGARLSGAGATFPAPLYEKWAVEYGKVNPGAKVDYQATGSGGGIKAITDQTVAFAGSDAPLTKKELAKIGAPVVQIPTAAGAVVLAYHLPGAPRLVVDDALLADVFTGRVTRWSDARIAALNPGVALPDLAITPAWRTDGSGTTHVFTTWLAGRSAAFKGAVGAGKQVAWPVGQGGKGNAGVTAIVQQTPGAIGYVELAYATANKLSHAAVVNAAGKAVRADGGSIAAAADAAATSMSGPHLVADLWNRPGDGTYPIASFTYLVVYQDLRNLKSLAEAKALGGFLWWATHEGQALAPGLDYVPLSPGVRAKVEAALKTLAYQGTPVVG